MPRPHRPPTPIPEHEPDQITGQTSILDLLNESNPPATNRSRSGVAVARRTDPDTSWNAANTIDPDEINERQRHVYEALRYVGPATDIELAVFYFNSGRPWQSPSGLRTRRAELVDRGLVIDTGKRRPTTTGRPAIVWAVRGTES